MSDWKRLTGLYDKYEVNSQGKVRNDKGIWLVPLRTSDKLWYYSLIPKKEIRDPITMKVTRTPFVRAHYLIHYLVAEAYLSNPNKFGQVIFRDHNVDNYIADNLEWVPAS